MAWTDIFVKDRAGVYLEYYPDTDELTITDSGGTIDIIDCVMNYSCDELVKAVRESFKEAKMDVEESTVYYGVRDVMSGEKDFWE